MPLSTQVTTRVSSVVLVSMTNPDVQGATSIDAVRFAAAVTDAEADFLTYVGVPYDDGDARHVALAVEGVLARLALAGSSTRQAAEARLEKWRDRCEYCRKIWGANARLAVRTNSQLTPTPDSPDGRTVRPAFDPRYTEGAIPDPPQFGGGSTDYPE